MSKTITSLDTNTDTFQNWTDKTNEIITVISSEAVTANSSGATTTGNGFVIGVFGANVIFANTSLRGGNTTVTNTLYITSNVNVSNTLNVNTLNVTDSLTINGSPVVSVTKISDTTSTTSAELIDQFTTTTFSGCEYIAAIKDSSANAYQMSKLLVLHDTGNSYITEYAVLISNTVLGVFSTNVDSTNCRLWLTPTVSGTTVKLTRTDVNAL